jgi:hypothetical protein
MYEVFILFSSLRSLGNSAVLTLYVFRVTGDKTTRLNKSILIKAIVNAITINYEAKC